MGKTLVSSALIDRVVAAIGPRSSIEVPVGFKCFVPGPLSRCDVAFGGEESSGMPRSCARTARVWTDR